MTENEQFIYDSIVSQIKMGFLPLEEIKDIVLEQVQDNEFEDEITTEWVNFNIESEYKKHIEESSKWRKPTDTENLIKAFEELCCQNIIALHNAGYTTSDGQYEVAEVERELRKNGIVSTGYCFYHEQDLENAIIDEEPCLYLAFQKIENSNDKITREIGRKISKILRENGFTVEWSEDPRKKIMLKNFRWQKVYEESTEDLLDYDKVIKLMLKR